MGDVVLGDDHAAAGVFIEAVHDAGAHLAADAAEVVDVMQQGIHERAIGIALGGMHDESGWFVDDDDVAVLKEDRDGDVLRFDLDRHDLRDGHVDGIAVLQDGTRLHRSAVQGDVAFFDQVLDTGA